MDSCAKHTLASHWIHIMRLMNAARASLSLSLLPCWRGRDKDRRWTRQRHGKLVHYHQLNLCYGQTTFDSLKGLFNKLFFLYMASPNVHIRDYVQNWSKPRAWDCKIKIPPDSYYGCSGSHIYFKRRKIVYTPFKPVADIQNKQNPNSIFFFY